MASVLAITIEGIATGLVGTYGSNTAVSPAIDRIAAYGLVLDQCFVDSVDVLGQLESLWTARHALQPANPPADKLATIWEQMHSAQRPACLLTDNPQAAQLAEAMGCRSVTLIQPPENTEAVNDMDDCAALALFVAAAEEVSHSATDTDSSGSLIWVHSSGLRLTWDAPLALRRRFTDDEDPDPPSEVGPPAIEVDATTDPDLIVGWGQVAAAQMAIFDDGIASLDAALETRKDGRQWSCMVASLGGVPLGEHGRIGWGKPQLHGEELHMVAIVRPSPPLPVGSRRAEICQLPDLAVTLLDCLRLTPPSTQKNDTHLNFPAWGHNVFTLGPCEFPKLWPTQHKIAAVVMGQTTWVRTPAWSALFEEDSTTKLYVKPDDRWEVSDIASRRADIAESMKTLAEAFIQVANSGNRSELHDVADEMCNLLR